MVNLCIIIQCNHYTSRETEKYSWDRLEGWKQVYIQHEPNAQLGVCMCLCLGKGGVCVCVFWCECIWYSMRFSMYLSDMFVGLSDSGNLEMCLCVWGVCMDLSICISIYGCVHVWTNTQRWKNSKPKHWSDHHSYSWIGRINFINYIFHQ